jgi:16S rRNA C967 or C1407 C5-methylase (RsmB/RsmF family)
MIHEQGSQDDKYLTYREAINLFATKEDVRAVSQNVNELKANVQNLVPRQEQELHWTIEKNWRDEVNKKLERLTSNQLPGYVLPMLGVITTILLAFFLHR